MLTSRKIDGGPGCCAKIGEASSVKAAMESAALNFTLNGSRFLSPRIFPLEKLEEKFPQLTR
jgi:hypothetical protein